MTRDNHERERGGAAGGCWEIGDGNPLIFIEMGLSAYFLCARGLPSFQALYKPKDEF